jgi:hypothetical protein
MAGIKKRSIYLLVMSAVLFVSVSYSQAEFKAWAPISPQFVGGNPLNGQWLLNKEQATNENSDDRLDKMMDRLIGRIDHMTDTISDRLDNLNLTLDMPIMMQVGSNNTGVIGNSGGNASPATEHTGALSGFKPSLGME